METFMKYELLSEVCRQFSAEQTSSGILARLTPESITMMEESTKSGGTDYIISIGKYRFRLNLIDCYYRSIDDQEETIGYFTNFYIGNVAIEGGDAFVPAKGTGNPRVWITICKLDAIIGCAKISSYLNIQNIFYSTTVNHTVASFRNRVEHVICKVRDINNVPLLINKRAMADAYFDTVASIIGLENQNWDNIANRLYPTFPEKYGYPMEVSKDGLQAFRSLYDKHLSKVLRLSAAPEEGEDPEFYTRIFPDYENPYGVIIYTQIGSPKDAFMSADVEDWRFSLSVNPLTFTCKYADLDDQVGAEEVDIFNPDPRVIGDPIRKSALVIIMDAIFTDIISKNFSLYKRLYTTGDPGLRTSEEKVNNFVDRLMKQMKLNYPPTDNNIDIKKCVKMETKNNGITLIAVGSVFLAVAIDGIGLVDSAMDGTVTKEMTWDDVFYNIDRTNLRLDDVCDNFELVSWLNVCPDNAESQVLLSEMGTFCARILYQMTEEEEVSTERSKANES